MAKEKINKDMLIAELVHKHPETAEVFFDHGLHCIGCAMAAHETIEQGASAHGLDIDKLIKDLNAAVKKEDKDESED